MKSDLEKLEAILRVRPIEGVDGYPDNSAFWLSDNDEPFEPWNSVDQALMLLEGKGYSISIRSGCESRAVVWDPDIVAAETFTAYSLMTARAIFEACWKAVEGDNVR